MLFFVCFCCSPFSFFFFFYTFVQWVHVLYWSINHIQEATVCDCLTGHFLRVYLHQKWLYPQWSYNVMTADPPDEKQHLSPHTSTSCFSYSEEIFLFSSGVSRCFVKQHQQPLHADLDGCGHQDASSLVLSVDPLVAAGGGRRAVGGHGGVVGVHHDASFRHHAGRWQALLLQSVH